MTSNHNTKFKHASSRSIPPTPRAVVGVFVNIDVLGHELALGELVDYFRVRVSNVDSSLKEVLSFRFYYNSRLGRDLAAAKPECFNWVYRFEFEVRSFIRLMKFTKLSSLYTLISTEF